MRLSFKHIRAARWDEPAGSSGAAAWEALCLTPTNTLDGSEWEESWSGRRPPVKCQLLLAPANPNIAPPSPAHHERRPGGFHASGSNGK